MSIPSNLCKVCGDRAYSGRYGALACGGCNIFFRRAFLQKKYFSCSRDRKCVVYYTNRISCRSCRLQKCLHVGMSVDAFKIRGHLTSPLTENLLVTLTKLQMIQFAEHYQYFKDHNVDIAFRVANVRHRRRARTRDANISLQLSLKHATEWCNMLRPFKKLSTETKNHFLAEYFIAFMLIDQGYKTAKQTDRNIWLLHNESFVHLGTESSKNHFLHSIANPFHMLKVDKKECAALKTILILKPSCISPKIYYGQESAIACLYNECMNELMRHSLGRGGAIRFGEIVLLLSAIRCGVKDVYNSMREPGFFDFESLSENVRNVLLE